MVPPTRFVDTGRARIAYQDVGPTTPGATGARPPLLLVHGWAGSKDLWQLALPLLAADHRCVALDYPGHGESPPGTTSTLANLAEHVVAVAQALELEPALVVGHSMGALVALHLALDHPTTVRALVLSCPPHPEVGVWSGRLVLGTPLEMPVLRGSRHFNRLLGLAAPDTGGGRLGQRLRRSRVAGEVDVTTLQETLRAVYDTGLAGRLADLRVPLLVLAGALDLTAPPTGARYVAAQVPGAALRIFPRVAHHPMDEATADYAAAIRRFADHIDGLGRNSG